MGGSPPAPSAYPPQNVSYKKAKNSFRRQAHLLLRDKKRGFATSLGTHSPRRSYELGQYLCAKDSDLTEGNQRHPKQVYPIYQNMQFMVLKKFRGWWGRGQGCGEGHAGGEPHSDSNLRHQKKWSSKFGQNFCETSQISIFTKNFDKKWVKSGFFAPGAFGAM